MQKTGFQTWGFVIYRGTYSDDAAWQRYLDLMKEKIRAYLEEHDLAELLLQYLDFTIIEDPAFDGASKDTVRNAFREWASHRCVERDGAGADDPYLTIHHLAPRFSHCIYVDEGSMKTLARYEAWEDPGTYKPMKPKVACALVDVNCDADGLGRDGYPDVEGCTRRYTGWSYLSLDCIPSMYDTQSVESTHGCEEYDYIYTRPPFIFPSSNTSTFEGSRVPT